MPKRSPEKQLELDKYLAITLAAIDYNSAREPGSMVCDGHDPMIDIYEWQRNQIRNFYAKGRLEYLQQKFHRYSSWMSFNSDLGFNDYVKSHTGYDVDILESLREDVDLVLQRGSIENEADRRNVSSLFHALPAVETESELSDKLAAMLHEFERTKKPSKDLVFNNIYHQDDLIVEEVTIISGGGRLYDYGQHRSESPDRRKRLFLSRSGKKQRGYTSVNLHFPNGSGCIFQANVNSPEISASWKNDHTILILTKSEYETPIRVQKVESHGELVNVVYEEL